MTLDPSAPGLQPEVDEPLLTTSQLARIVQHHPDTITRSWVRQLGCPYELRTPSGYRFKLSRVKAHIPKIKTDAGELCNCRQAKVNRHAGAVEASTARRGVAASAPAASRSAPACP